MSSASSRPEVGAPPAWHFPTPEVRILDNGLTVWCYHRPGQYVVSVALVLDLPLSVEDPAREGIASICLHTLDEGTQAHPGPSYAEVLESSGAVFGGSVSLSATTCSLEVPVTSYADAVPLFAEAVRAPALADADVERHVALRLAEIEQHRATSSHLASILTRATLFEPASRAARMNGGGSVTVAAVGPDDVRAFHHRWYSPAGAVLVVAGDFLGGDWFAPIDAAFGSWQATGPRPDHPAPAHADPTRRLVRRDGAVQSDVRLAGPGIDRRDPRWPALQVAAYAMGGAFCSRLNRVLREERGYTYGISLSPHPLREGGYWTVGGSFRNEVVGAAVDEALEILDVSQRPFTPAEVNDAWSYLVGVAPLRFATAQGVAEQAAAVAAAGLDHTVVDVTLQRLRTVTPDEATQAYTSLVTRPALVAVGDAESLAPLGEPQDVPPL